MLSHRHCAWLSQQLAAIGCGVLAHVTVPDDQAAIESAIRDAAPRCDALIISGGLGPTADDLTRQHRVTVTIRCADLQGRDLTSADPLRSRKLQVALARIGIDVAVIAGATPDPGLRELAAAGGDGIRAQPGDLTALRDFAAAQLTEPTAGDAARRNRIRRTPSAAGSAARIVL